MDKNQLFHEYFLEWMNLYKLGAVRPITFGKYAVTLHQIQKIAPNVKLSDLTRQTYQTILNEYAKKHEKRTTMDFHRHLRSALTDALDDGLIERDPTRRAVLKGSVQRHHKNKFLSEEELMKLLAQLDLHGPLSWDHLIFLISKTGLRFGEALGLTPADFDFEKRILKISKTWDYKSKDGNFALTKNESSKRAIKVDSNLVFVFKDLLNNMKAEQPIFVQVGTHVFNRTINNILEKHCLQADIPIISIHGLRHTHASLLLYAGVSIASVSRRLGHSNITTTQTTYLHIIKELEDEDNEKIVNYLNKLS